MIKKIFKIFSLLLVFLIVVVFALEYINDKPKSILGSVSISDPGFSSGAPEP